MILEGQTGRELLLSPIQIAGSAGEDAPASAFSLLQIWLLPLLAAILLSLLLPYLFARLIRRQQGNPQLAGRRQLRQFRAAVLCLVWPGLLHYALFVYRNHIQEALFTYGGRLLLSLRFLGLGLLIFSLMPFLLHLLGRGFRTLDTRKHETLYRIFLFCGKALTAVLILAAILENWQINFTGLVTGLGIGSVAIALAAQSLLSNLIAGLSLMMDRPFERGDFVRIGSLSGVVEAIGWRSTRIRSLSEELLVIPNANVTNSEISNLSRQNKRRIMLQFRILRRGRSEDACKLRRFMQDVSELVGRRPLCRTEDGIEVYLDSLDSNAYNVFVNYYIQTTDYRSYLNERTEILMASSALLERLELNLLRPFAEAE